MAQRICLFPGTFDPITKGHTDIIDRALDLFDSLIIGIGINSSKQPMFSIEQRIEWIERIYKNEPKIKVIAYEGLTIDCCKNNNAQFILRGIRYINDFEYEKAIADMNRMLAPEVETVFLTCTPLYSTISSTLVRDVIRNNGNVHQFIPEAIVQDFKTSS
ncbi:MAG: pantetheine-phosphate adenylyltransferase [Bacteroidota bacterium]|jgi:pantetheine-phosphate adenylyltransferase